MSRYERIDGSPNIKYPTVIMQIREMTMICTTRTKYQQYTINKGSTALNIIF